jgi:hypothetical protein
VATLDVAFVLEALAELERELSSAWCSVENHEPTAQLRSFVVLTGIKIRILRDRALTQVEPSDVLDANELALRARTNVILVHLAILRELDREAPLAAWMFAGRLANVDAISTFVLAQVGRINASWFRDRVALGNADLAYAMIGRDPDLAYFLRSGAARRSEPIRTACRAIAAVVEVRLGGFSATSRTPADGFQP